MTTPDPDRVAPPPRLRWLVVGVWTVPAILSAFETVVFSQRAGRPIAVWQAFVAEAPQWYGWALLTPLVVWLGRRFPVRQPLRATPVLVHLAAAVVGGALIAVAEAAVSGTIRPMAGTLLESFRNWFLSGLPATVVVYGAILGASYAWDARVRLQQRDRETAELEMALRSAQLDALRMQLQPHFLFNSLNAIMALVRDQDTERAITMLTLLSDLLRSAVNAGNANETTLGAEVEFVTRYLGIEQVRFGDRLRVSIDVQEDLHGVAVPIFLLQPFVENSLKHGILRERGPNEVRIAATREGGEMVVTVQDDGRGIDASAPSSGGIGIANARDRLARMYGDAAVLTVANATVGPGVAVKVRLPLRAMSVPGE